MTVEKFRVHASGTDVVIKGSEGTHLTVQSGDTQQAGVIAARTSSMLNHHNRREALELGHTGSYSGSSVLPGVIGSEHVEDRATLLRVAHQAEAQAELWDRYRERMRAVLYPPDVAEIEAPPGIGHYNIITEVRFSHTRPRNAREIPRELREALLLASAYATENMQAYLDVADACRQEHRNRYAGEDAALRDQAKAQMGAELGEGDQIP